KEQSHAGTVGLVVLRHGLFTVGDTVGEALDRHRRLVAMAAELAEAAVGGATDGHTGSDAHADIYALARLRATLCAVAGRPMVVRHHDDAQVRRFLADPGLRAATQEGPLTPDHALWTKRVPLLGTDIARYAEEYERYVA